MRARTMSDPIVSLLAYVHSRTASLDTESLCDSAWDHYKKVCAERDQIKAECARLRRVNEKVVVDLDEMKAERDRLREALIEISVPGCVWSSPYGRANHCRERYDNKKEWCFRCFARDALEAPPDA